MAQRTATKLLALALLALGLLWPSGPARALGSCTVGATDMAFGIYDPFAGGPLDSTSTVSVTCTSVGIPVIFYEVRLSAGQAGSFNPRAMTNGTSQLNYNLYLNNSRTQVWGDGSSGTQARRRFYFLFPVGNTQTVRETVRGRVFAGQNVSVGTYLDTITVTVIF